MPELDFIAVGQPVHQDRISDTHSVSTEAGEKITVVDGVADHGFNNFYPESFGNTAGIGFEEYSLPEIDDLMIL
jgi:hypothetical protein